MFTVCIPENSHKIQFIYKFIYGVMNLYPACGFFNITDSPLKEFEYIKVKDLFMRKISGNELKLNVDKEKYMEAYCLDKIDKQGISFKEYLDLCFIFELCNVHIVPYNVQQQFMESVDVAISLCCISVCPDGLNEIIVDGDKFNEDKIRNFLSH